MKSMDIGIFILAGGRGSRLKSCYPKPLYPVLGYPALFYVLKSVEHLPYPITVISSEEVWKKGRKHFPDLTFLKQEKAGYGTGWALMSASEHIRKYTQILVIQADDILITSRFIDKLLSIQEENINVISGKKQKNSKSSDMLESKKGLLCQIGNSGNILNIGRYLFQTSELLNSLEKLQSNSGEYLLTDAVNSMIESGSVFKIIEEKEQFNNMNTTLAVIEAEKTISQKINYSHIDSGVYIEYPEMTKISPTATIKKGTRICGISHIEGPTVIGENCLISDSRISDSHLCSEVDISGSTIEFSSIGCAANILFSHIKDAIIKKDVKVGPFAHLRPGVLLENNVKIGNFCEIKKSHLGTGTKVSHLSYLGDADVGQNANIGGGVITANYDGKTKHQTNIHDNVFVGCNSTLIAPVELFDNSLVAAGSTITDDVPPNVLAFGRARQTNKNRKG